MRNENFDCFKREQDICHRKPQYPAEIQLHVNPCLKGYLTSLIELEIMVLQ